MIKIINISKNPQRGGRNQYALMINNTEIAEFEHVYEEGLAGCLRKAADAAEQIQLSEISDLMNYMIMEKEGAVWQKK